MSTVNLAMSLTESSTVCELLERRGSTVAGHRCLVNFNGAAPKRLNFPSLSVNRSSPAEQRIGPAQKTQSELRECQALSTHVHLLQKQHVSRKTQADRHKTQQTERSTKERLPSKRHKLNEVRAIRHPRRTGGGAAVKGMSAYQEVEAANKVPAMSGTVLGVSFDNLTDGSKRDSRFVDNWVN